MVHVFDHLADTRIPNGNRTSKWHTFKFYEVCGLIKNLITVLANYSNNHLFIYKGSHTINVIIRARLFVDAESIAVIQGVHNLFTNSTLIN